MIQNKRFALAYRTCAVLFAAIGLLKQIGAFEGKVNFGSFMFYTIQSNLLAVILFAFLVIRTGQSLRKGLQGGAGRDTRLGMVCAVDLLVTMVVFWVLLAPEVSVAYLWTFDNIAVHAVTPLLCLFDYILFSEPQRLKYQDVYYVCIYPIFYVVFTSIAGFAGYAYSFSSTFSGPNTGHIDVTPVRFPYFFLDFDRLGLAVIVYTAAILALLIVLSHIIFILSRRFRPISQSEHHPVS